MCNQFQTLRFAAGESVQRLTEPQVTKSDFIKDIEFAAELFGLANQREELDRFTYCHLEDVVDRSAVQLHFQDVRLEPAAFALRAAHVEIAQELHLDFLEAGPATALAASAAGVERECRRRESLRLRFR